MFEICRRFIHEYRVRSNQDWVGYMWKDSFSGIMNRCIAISIVLSPLSVNPTKWLNTLKQFVDFCRRICLSVFDHLVGFALKGLIYASGFHLQITSLWPRMCNNDYSKIEIFPWFFQQNLYRIPGWLLV